MPKRTVITDLMREAERRSARTVVLALAKTIRSVVRLGTDAKLDDFDELVATAVRGEPDGATALASFARGLIGDTESCRRLDEVAGDCESPLVELLESFDEERVHSRAGRITRFDSLLIDIRNAPDLANRDEGAEPNGDGTRNGDNDKGAETREPDDEVKVEIESPDGTKVSMSKKGSATKGGSDEEEEDEEPSEKAPPTIYGEEDEAGRELYAIAIHTLRCKEVTDYFLIGNDDEIAYVARGVARFKNQTRVPFLVTTASPAVKIDINDGDVLSDMEHLVVPDDSNGHKLMRAETFLVNRYLFQGQKKLGQGGVFTDFAPFDLEDFIRANIQFTLFEDDSSVKEAIEKILKLLQSLANLAEKAVSAVGSAGPEPLKLILKTIESSDAFLELNKIIQELINSSDKIAGTDLIITQEQIRAAFAPGATPAIEHFPPAAQDSASASFDYVAGRPEQVRTLKGKGGEYVLTLRYERHPAAQ